jgi:hypothetical protein
MNNRGLWVDYIQGLMVIAAVTVTFIILQQTWTHTIKEQGVKMGADTDISLLISTVWDAWPILVGLAFAGAMLRAANKGRGGGGYVSI